MCHDTKIALLLSSISFEDSSKQSKTHQNIPDVVNAMAAVMDLVHVLDSVQLPITSDLKALCISGFVHYFLINRQKSISISRVIRLF